MLYSIQSGNEVRGHFLVPPTVMSPEVFAHVLRAALNESGILGQNGVTDSPLRSSTSDVAEDRVVIDMIPAYGPAEQDRLNAIHQTVGILATPPAEQ